MAEPPQLLEVNLGSGQGHSVLDVVKAFEIASGCAVPYAVAARRTGDAAITWLIPSLAAKRLGWKTKRSLKICAAMVGPGNPPIPTAIARDPRHPAGAGRRRSRHALLLRRWGDASPESTKRVDHLGESLEHHPYSGMVPGLIAGLYSRDQIAIDLRRLAGEAGWLLCKRRSKDLT